MEMIVQHRGFTCKYSTLLLIREKMDAHYRALLSAKACVDSSLPRSLLTSIKYCDWQRRERSRQRTGDQNDHHANPANPSVHTVLRAPQPGHLTSRDHQQAQGPYQSPAQRTYSGDVLDRHPGVFHRVGQQPFTPRTHRNQHDSFLSQYRYYTPPPGQKKGQTERKKHPSSSQNTSGGSCHGHKYPAQWSMKYSATNTGADQAGREGEEKEGDEEEEEGKYLQFLEDVTNDILRYGFYSDSVLESVFSWQMTWRHDLSQVKMRRLTEELRASLNS
ncbi:spermatogenesis-associated protein 7 isoform X1 [Oncorhynchus kisutch]|uniref:spermatogenesis-associated protein 7 isoform X1 n=2 Tax=Oncorhynchus kisutch TaxID=8019 RepID=UPI00099F6918|nr:spermatogenesis-associated protein 7 isoform X1 [Oncorhynchus kisutch]